MKSEKGITLVSLGIYIVVILIALIMLSTITAYFRSNVNEFNTKTTVDLEFDKFNLYFIEEVKKTNNKIDETKSSETKIVFTSENIYEFSENSIMLNGNIKIAEKIDNCTFSFYTDENNLQSITVYMKVGETERTNEYTLSNKASENIDNEDYIYGYKKVEGTNEFNLTNSLATNLKSYRIYGNSIQDGEPSPTSPVEIQSVGDKSKNILNPKDIDVGESSGVVVTKENDFIVVNGTSTRAGSSFKVMDNIVLEPGTYVLSSEGSNNVTIAWRKYTDSGTASLLGGSGHGSKMVTLTEETTVYINIYTATLGKIYNNDKVRIMIAKSDSLIDFEPYGYKIPVKVSGKNLLDKNNITQASRLNITQFENGLTAVPIEATTTYYNIYYAIGNVDEYKGKTYTFSMNEYEGNFEKLVVYAVYGTPKSFTEIGSLSDNNTFTVPEEATGDLIIRFYMSNLRASLNHTLTLTNIQLEEGNIATEYEHYIEPITTNIYLDEPLRKVGDYADYIDFDKQEVIRNIESLELKVGNMNNTEDYPGWTNMNVLKEDYPGVNTVLSQVSSGVLNNISPNQTIARINCRNTGVLWMGALDSNIKLTQTEWIEKYPNLIFNVQYVKPSPREETIELPSIPTHKGTTIIEIDTEIPPSNAEVVYYSK